MSEIEKYQGIYQSSKFAKYGHTNHGRASIRHITKLQPESILDVGCGWNEFAKQMAGLLGKKCVGVDFACPGADVIAPVTELPFENKSFDLLTSFDMLEHLTEDEVDKALSEMARVSRRFVLSISYVTSVNKWEGQTLHPTVRPESWWITRLIRAGAIGIVKVGNYITGDWVKVLSFDKSAKVILVGNGPSVLEQANGEMIDSFDEVVRFNNYHIEGFEKFVGTKTTLWSTFFKRIDDQVRHDRVLCVHERDVAKDSVKEVFRVPSWYYERILSDVQRRYDWLTGFQRNFDKKLLATSGIIVASFLLEVLGVRKLTLIGFDHFSKQKSGLHHYWINHSFKQPPEHNGAIERMMFGELVHSGRVEYLNNQASVKGVIKYNNQTTTICH